MEETFLWQGSDPRTQAFKYPVAQGRRSNGVTGEDWPGLVYERIS